jgi:hypothetical protein
LLILTLTLLRFQRIQNISGLSKDEHRPGDTVFDDADRQCGEHMLRGLFTRRYFVSCFGGAVAMWPIAARAQSRPALIGMLASGFADSSAIFVDAFKQGMHENGLIEGRDYVLDVRWAECDYARFPALAAELAQRDCSLIVVTTIAAARVAQRVTREWRAT